MKLKNNEYIKIKDIDHLKRLCEENGVDYSNRLQEWFNNERFNTMYLSDQIMFNYITPIYKLKDMGYTEVFDEPQEKKMRYFVVSFDAYRNNGEKGSGQHNFISESYVNRSYIERICRLDDSQLKKVIITNILELSQSDYEDFIR